MSTVEALKMAIEAISNGTDTDEAIDACKSALFEIDNSEPVAIVKNGNVHWIVDNWPDDTELFTSPPKREWKGLSRDEKTRLSLKYSGHLFYELCNAIEAKLKELNHD